MKTTLETFQRCSPFSTLTTSELERVLNLVELVKFEADELIIRQGSQGDGLYLIKSGSVSVTLRHPGDKLVNVGILREGDEFGEMALLDKGVTRNTVKALEKTCCYFLSANYFDMLRFGDPILGSKVNYAITEQVCQLIQDTNEKILHCLSQNPSYHNSKTLYKNIISARQKVKKYDHELGENTNYLSQIGILRYFSQRELETLIDYFELCEATRKTLIIKKGSVASSCYIPIRGCVRIILDAKDVISMLNVQGPGGLFGEAAFIFNHPHLFSCVAYEDCVLFELKEKAWERLRKDNVYLWYKLFDVICKSLLSEMRFTQMQLVRVESELREL